MLSLLCYDQKFGLYLVEQNPVQKKDSIITQDPYLSERVKLSNCTSRP